MDLGAGRAVAFRVKRKCTRVSVDRPRRRAWPAPATVGWAGGRPATSDRPRDPPPDRDLAPQAPFAARAPGAEPGMGEARRVTLDARGRTEGAEPAVLLRTATRSRRCRSSRPKRWRTPGRRPGMPRAAASAGPRPRAVPTSRVPARWTRGARSCASRIADTWTATIRSCGRLGGRRAGDGRRPRPGAPRVLTRSERTRHVPGAALARAGARGPAPRPLAEVARDVAEVAAEALPP